MKKSKYIPLGLGVLMSAMLLTGCGGGKDSDGGEASNGKKEKLTLGIWDENQRPTMDALAEAYEIKM